MSAGGRTPLACGARAVVAVAGALAAACSGETTGENTPTAADDAQIWFFGWPAALLLVGPIALAAFLAIRRKKGRGPDLPRYDDLNFDDDVLGAQMPVLVHFARDWSVANRAALAQTEILAWQNRGAVTVGLLDVEACPRVMERFPGLEPPAYLLFHRGRKLFHRPGLRQADDLQQDIDVALSREGFEPGLPRGTR